jgi:hypothetical protein
MQFSTEIDDPLVLAGVKEASVNVDLSKLELSDRTNGSFFVVGGRAYYEAEVMGYKISSFTSRGVLDKLNYKEPISMKVDTVYDKYQW